MLRRIKPTMTVYPCHHRSSAGAEHENPSVWLTWEAIERSTSIPPATWSLISRARSKWIRSRYENIATYPSRKRFAAPQCTQ